MIFINKSLLFVILCSIFIPFSALQETKIQNEIVKCFETGNSKSLSNYFNQSVELVITGNNKLYSKAQAQQVVSKFFSENPPESFQIISNSTKDGAKNIIGLLITKKGSFRVYIVLKKTDDRDFIHLLKIEIRQN